MRRKIAVIVLFSIAMAALESAVVVYLRVLYYPEEFTVAFRVIDPAILYVELIREIATLIMLFSVGYLSGSTFKERLAYFLLSFAVWDIFYYVWLKTFIDWPASVLDWDILFLIPWTWLGPVLAPVICSVTMIVFAVVLLSREGTTFSKTVWSFLLAGIVIILFTFMKDYGSLIIMNGFFADYANLMNNAEFIRMASAYIPTSYNWYLFVVGECLIGAAIYKLF
jgi:hypothetical protein